MNKETLIQRQILIALSDVGCLVFRNETGGFYTGRPIHRDGTTITLSGSRMIQVGLCVGSSDIIGITSTGRFIAIEVKTEKGKTSAAQQLFIDAIIRNGGIAGVARSVEDAVQLVTG